MKLTEKRLQDVSEIEVRYFTGPSSKYDFSSILVVKYRGDYGYGSEGNGDARFMLGMAQAGISTFFPCGLIHDLSELSYEWGDMLECVFIGPDCASSPRAIVVGPKCEEAVRTLFLGVNSEEPIEKIGDVFRSLDAAWAYVDAQIK
jgi:hypothetical protein